MQDEKRAKPYLLLLAGALPAAFCWAEFARRLHLYRKYGSQPFVNHVADGYFGWMYLIAGAALVAFAVGLALAIRRKAVGRAIAYVGAAALTISCAVAFYLAHDRGVIVTYGEFIQRLGP